MAKGQLADLFGPSALPLDIFMRSLSLDRLSIETWKTKRGLDDEIASVLQSYADGVNDYASGISFWATDDKPQTGRMFPFEFHALGILNFDLWTPSDSLLVLRLFNLQVTWNWGSDLQREAARQSHPEIAELLDDLMPITSDRLFEMIPTVDDDDLKRAGQFSDSPLVERYRAKADEIKKASPPLTPRN